MARIIENGATVPHATSVVTSSRRALGLPIDMGEGLRRSTLAESVANQLGEAIVGGRYAVGETLPNESGLSEQFAVSRSVVREALKMLSVKGFLASRPKRGTWVKPQSGWNVFDTDAFHWLCKAHPVREVLAQSFAFRLIIEPAAAGLAATVASDADLRDLRRTLLTLESSNPATPADTVAFHKQILSASGNLFFSQMANFIELVLSTAVRSCHMEGNVHYRRYAEVANGVCARNQQGAEITMRALLQEQYEFLTARRDSAHTRPLPRASRLSTGQRE